MRTRNTSVSTYSAMVSMHMTFASCAMALIIDSERALVTASRTKLPSILIDRKSTRLNSSHQIISYAVFCLKKKKKEHTQYCVRTPHYDVTRSCTATEHVP